MPFGGGSGTSYLPLGAGAIPTSYTEKLRRIRDVEEFGAKGDGTTDDSAAFNAAITALGSGGGTLFLNKASYAIGAPLSGTAKNIRIVGRVGQPTLIKLASGGYASFFHSDVGAYSGYRCENIAFDGNRAAVLGASLPGYSFYVNSTQNLSFDRCFFRDLHYIYLANSAHVSFLDCEFVGTRPGVMTAGVQDPAAVPSALYGEAAILGASNRDIRFTRCNFQFLQAGVNGYTDDTARSRGLYLDHCSFRNDWWATPYITFKFTPTSYNAGTRILTASATDFTGHFTNFEIMSVPILVSSASSFSSIIAGNVNAPSTQFATAQIGDVIETNDGRRAEIISLSSSSSVYVRGWEGIDTFERCDQPANNIGWRLTRHYASMGYFQGSTHEIFLQSDPVNPFTGEHLVESGGTMVGVVCRQLSKTYYSGLNINGGQDELRVTNCRFRGSWADQCSMFYSHAPVVTGCTFEMGEDEGITCTGCVRSILSFNTFENSGTNAIFVANSHNTSIMGNVIRNWALTNPYVRGAIDGSAKNLAVVGNTVDVDQTAGYGGASAYLLSLHDGDSTGTVVSGNVDGGARTASLFVDNVAAPALHAIKAHDLKTIDGNGQANVDWNPG